MSDICHDFLYFIQIIIIFKCYKIFSFHKVIYRHGLIYKSCNGKCIIGCCDNGSTMLLCQFLNGYRRTRTLAYYDTCRSHLYSTKLHLISVSKNYKIILFDIKLHHIGICSRHYNLAFIKIGFIISYHQ